MERVVIAPSFQGSIFSLIFDKISDIMDIARVYENAWRALSPQLGLRGIFNGFYAECAGIRQVAEKPKIR